jgi:formylglycine-generating enzyme required for sulfatase activity
MIVVPRGKFQMGSEDDYLHARPVHEVRIEYDLAVGKYPVTRGEWRKYADETGRKTTNTGDWLSPGFRQDDNHPVVCMRWEEAQAYIDWLSQKTGQRYRMLSEAEYEYANRAGTRTSQFWGDSYNDMRLYANKARKGTTPVGSFKPNPWGLFDTTGNVWSWTQDTWHENYNGAPTDGSAWEMGRSSERVLRGGSWSDDHHHSACRRGYGHAYNDVGLRLARTL